MPKVSVIIPVYNAEQWLRGCIDSVIGQTFQDFEIILVDDGSTDASGAICDEYAKSDGRIKVIHQQNAGVSAARNKGLDLASGEWVSFIDADDILIENAYYTLTSQISDDCVLSVGGYNIYAEDHYTTESRFPDRKLEIDEFIKWLFTSDPYYQGYLWNKVFDRAIIEKSNIRFDADIKYNEDRLFCVRYICSASGEIAVTDVPVYDYYVRGNGAMSSIKKGYCYNYLTDFIAFARMIDVLKLSKYEVVLNYAEARFDRSYNEQLQLVKKWGIEDSAIKRKIKGIYRKRIPFRRDFARFMKKHANNIKSRIKNVF